MPNFRGSISHRNQQPDVLEMFRFHCHIFRTHITDDNDDRHSLALTGRSKAFYSDLAPSAPFDLYFVDKYRNEHRGKNSCLKL